MPRGRPRRQDIDQPQAPMNPDDKKAEEIPENEKRRQEVLNMHKNSAETEEEKRKSIKSRGY